MCTTDSTAFQSAATQTDGSSLPAGGLQWQSSPDDSTWSNISGVVGTSNPLAFHPQVSDDGNHYRAAWKNVSTSDPTAFSNSAQLTVQTPPLLTANPSGATASEDNRDVT